MQIGRTAAMKLQEAALFCSVIAVLLYVNTLDCGYCFDDHSVIKLNQDLRPETPWRQLLENDFWGAGMKSRISHKSYRPLTVATFRLNYMLHELQPLGYHLVNVLLHSAVCYLYVLLCGVVFSEVWPALIAGLLFAVHPIHTEAVAGLVGRAELVASIFYLLAFFSYRRAAQKPGHTSAVWLCVSLLSTLCSALSKEQGITAVAVCLAYDVLYCVKIDVAALFKLELKPSQPVAKCGRSGRQLAGSVALKPCVKSFAVRAIILTVFTVAFMVFRVWVMGGRMPAFHLEAANPAVLEPTPLRQLHWLYLCFSNTWLLLSPSTLCADWSNGSIPLIRSIFDVRNLATFFLFSTIAMLTAIMIRRNRTQLIFAFSLLVLPYLPASNLFFPVGFVVAERVLYLPSMGFCMLISLIYQELTNRGKHWMRFIKPCLLFLLILYSTKTVLRNRDWYSEETIWKSAAPVNPNNAKVYTNMAATYQTANDTEMVLLVLRRGAELHPNMLMLWVNMAHVHEKKGRFEEAEEDLQKALSLVPKGKKMVFHVGSETVNVYADLARVIKRNSSRLEEAAKLYLKAASLEVRPSTITYWTMEAGNCYLEMRDLERARNTLLEAVQADPDSADANYNVAVVYDKEDNSKMTEKYLRQAVALNNVHSLAVNTLAIILSDSDDAGKQEEALLMFQQATRSHPEDYKPLWRIGKIYVARNQLDRAETNFKQALNLSPSSPQVLYSLGKLCSRRGEYARAVTFLEKMIEIMPHTKIGAMLLVEAYEHTGDFEKAKKLSKMLEDVSASNVEAILMLAQQVRHSDHQSAEEYFRKALRYDPGNVKVLHEFGVFLSQTNKCLEAVRYLTLALQKLGEGTMDEGERKRRDAIVAALNSCTKQTVREEKNSREEKKNSREEKKNSGEEKKNSREEMKNSTAPQNSKRLPLEARALVKEQGAYHEHSLAENFAT